MEELFKAIATRWDSAAGAAVRAIATGNLWAPQAMHDVQGTGADPGISPKPYVRFFPVPGAVLDTNTSKIEQPLISFQGFTLPEDSYTTCLQLRDALVPVYDDVRLTMTGQNMVIAQRQTAGDPGPDPDAGFFFTVDYIFMYG